MMEQKKREMITKKMTRTVRGFFHSSFNKKTSRISVLTSYYPLTDENGYSLNMSWCLTCEMLRMVTKVNPFLLDVIAPLRSMLDIE